MKTLLLLLAVVSASAGTITNPLGLDWPWELVHVTTNVTGPVSVQIGEEVRPAQVDGSNVWFIATIKGGKSGEKTKDYRLQPGLTASPLNVKVEGDLQVTGAKTEVISRSPRGKRRFTIPTVKR